MKLMQQRLLVCAALVAASAAPLAYAEVKINFIEPDKFVDIGRTQWDRDDAMRGLTRVFEALAKKYVPQGQDVLFEVTDVDLAGTERPSFRHQDLRIVRSIDWPAISFRYTVKEGDKTVAQGQDRLADLDFQHRIGVNSYSAESYPYERRMLEDWFRAKFGTKGE